jgi:3-oxoacyl-[acyl-carrier-protein] synthase-3
VSSDGQTLIPDHRPSGLGCGRPTEITSLATYVPPRLLTNADLEKMVDTTSEWILQRTGIHTRHIVDPGVATSDLGTQAALKAIAQAGLTPNDIDLIIVGTTTPDMFFPSTAALIQHKIGAHRAWGFDLAGACSGFNFSLATASQLVSTGRHNHALVVGADVMSSIIDYTDRATCVLFGDGAGAVVVSAARDPSLAILDFAHEIDGSGGVSLNMPAGGSLRPASRETVEQRLHYVKQDGSAVFKFAVRKTEEISRVILQRNGLKADDIGLFVSHQANRRIITAAADHPARTRGLRSGRPAEEGRPRPARLGRRRLHRGRRPPALGYLTRVTLFTQRSRAPSLFHYGT